jgi:hypothetical protein
MCKTNKVMNFRAIDPRDQRAGMSGGGETDRRVWAEFYDASANDLRHTELEREFNRLWRVAGEVASSPSEADEEALYVARAKRLAVDGLGALMAKYARERAGRPARPSTKSMSTRSYERSALVVAIAKVAPANRQTCTRSGGPASRHGRPFAMAGRSTLTLQQKKSVPIGIADQQSWPILAEHHCSGRDEADMAWSKPVLQRGHVVDFEQQPCRRDVVAA